MKKHNFLVLLGCFIAGIQTNLKVEQETLDAFDECSDIDELVDEVSLRISSTGGDLVRAKAFIFDNIIDWLNMPSKRLDLTDN